MGAAYRPEAVAPAVNHGMAKVQPTDACEAARQRASPTVSDCETVMKCSV